MLKQLKSKSCPQGLEFRERQRPKILVHHNSCQNNEGFLTALSLFNILVIGKNFEDCIKNFSFLEYVILDVKNASRHEYTVSILSMGHYLVFYP